MRNKRIAINVRLGSTHFKSCAKFPFLKVSKNPTHMKGNGLDKATKLQIGEFRNKDGWKPFAVYNFFGFGNGL
jgi:hypothetical protein